MCDLVAQFRYKPEPTLFKVPHDRMPVMRDQLRNGERMPCHFGEPLAVDDYCPMFLNRRELEYVLLQPCEIYVEQVRRAAIVAAAKDSTKEQPQ